MRPRRKGPMPGVPLEIPIAVLPLSSCGRFAKILGVPTDRERYVDDLDFATSDRLLRGAWHGTVTDLSTADPTRTLELDLTASRIESSRYDIEGWFEFEGEAP